MSSKKIMLKSYDGESFVIDEVVALQSQTIAHMIEDDCANSEIPLENVRGSILSKVIEYCNYHVETDSLSIEELNKFDDGFMKMDKSTVFDVMLAANYLKISDLVVLCSQTIADMIKDKNAEELRIFFNVERFYTRGRRSDSHGESMGF